MAKAKKSSKAGVSKVSQAPKTQTKINLITHEIEYDKTDSPPPVKRTRNSKPKHVFSPSKLVVLPAEKV